MQRRFSIGLLFLGMQLAAIFSARFVPERFFCWAPYDEHTLLRTEVYVQGRALSAREVEERYRYRMNGWEPRAVHNALNLVRQYEQTYGRNDSARVTIRYQTNGHPEKIWTFPEISD